MYYFLNYTILNYTLKLTLVILFFNTIIGVVQDLKKNNNNNYTPQHFAPTGIYNQKESLTRPQSV